MRAACGRVRVVETVHGFQVKDYHTQAVVHEQSYPKVRC